MHIIPFYNRSIFDDIDSAFDDLLWDGPRGYSLFPAQERQQAQQHKSAKNWSITVRLTGYKPDEVKVERAEDNATVKIHARHQEEGGSEDFSEIRRTIQVPDTVDRSKVEVDFTREGILVVKAPYLHRQQQQQQLQVAQAPRGGFNPWSMSPWSHWTEEMRALHNDMLQLSQQSFPGSMRSNFVKNADGSTQLQLDFDMSGYKPEEIHVAQEKNAVIVEAKQETKTEQGSSLKHFKRVFTLPPNIQVHEMTSKLLQDGHLRLEAPCELKETQQQKAIGAEGHNIPVKRSEKEGQKK